MGSRRPSETPYAAETVLLLCPRDLRLLRPGERCKACGATSPTLAELKAQLASAEVVIPRNPALLEDPR